jgi:hypothetical protein
VIRTPRLPAAAIRGTELLLRRVYGVREFTDDGDCIFRIAVRAAPDDLTLADGARVRRGDAILELHLWNEQLPQIPEQGAGIAWGAMTDRRARHSFGLLADHLAANPHLVAVRGEVAFGCKMDQRQCIRFARRFGFEIIASEATRLRQMRYRLDNFWFLSMTWVFNPHGLKGKPLHRERYCIWASRATIGRLWGAAAPRSTVFPRDAGIAAAARPVSIAKAAPVGGRPDPVVS